MMRRFVLILLGGAAMAAVAASGAAAKDVVRIVDSQSQVFANYGINQARHEGFYDAENLDASVIVARGGSDAVQAIVTGSQDIVVGPGILSVIAAYAKGAPITIVASAVKGARDVFWYVKADSPIKSFKDLNGKIFSYSSPGSLTHQVAQTIARDLGIQPKFVSTGGTAAVRTQMMSGQVDTAWSAAPASFELIRNGEARIIGTGHDAPSLRPLTTRVVAVNTNWLAKNRDVAVRALRALWKGQASMFASDNAMQTAIQRFADHWKIPIEDAKRIPDFYKLEDLTFFPIGGLDETLRIAQDYGFLKEPMTAEQKKGLVTVVYDPTK
jgi:NitT/TauT family transport system substrate-binding protein